MKATKIYKNIQKNYNNFIHINNYIFRFLPFVVLTLVD